MGYVQCGPIRVVAGAPICDPEILREIVTEFESDAQRTHQRVCYFHVGPRFVTAIRELRHYSFACIGSLACWHPREWHSSLRAHASLRYQIARARNKQITVHEMLPGKAANDAELRRIREEWLRRKHLPPLHFLIEPEIFGELADRRLFVAQRDRHKIGYLLCTPIPNCNGWLFEQWAHTNHAPLGTSELLVHSAMSTFASEGCATVTMGLIPLSSRAGITLGEPGPLWLRLLLRFMRWTANPLYNFKGLEYYKHKFRPHGFEPVYAVINHNHFQVGDVSAIAQAFAGSPLQLFAWKGLKKGLGQLRGIGPNSAGNRRSPRR